HVFIDTFSHLQYHDAAQHTPWCRSICGILILRDIGTFMNTYLECIPCFFNQALSAARLNGLSESDTWSLLSGIAAEIPKLRKEDNPPTMSRLIYAKIREFAKEDDPYKQVKESSNKHALAVYPALKSKVKNAQDPLCTALELSAAGNIIDFGANARIDVQKEISTIIDTTIETIRHEQSRHFNCAAFASALAKSRTILFLADNAGEIVFDRVLIELLKELNPGLRVTVAVRGAPVLNDCTLEDAEQSGIGASSDIISNGADAPGTILDICSPEFLHHFETSDMIISKGQGNYETLSSSDRNIFFILKAKCGVVARHAGCTKGEILLLLGRMTDIA
ncbi:MAG: DUF89 family protein, partial [Spirochaetales bacterium]|nr:DUF89 family protein [Spirochaetales bacterium]